MDFQKSDDDSYILNHLLTSKNIDYKEKLNDQQLKRYI